VPYVELAATNGQIKDMVYRTLILKLELCVQITLPKH
jgi:hypothetical protein